jgi:hypothetical protein
MSDLDQITTTLERLFHEEGQRIVFGNDPDHEFPAIRNGFRRASPFFPLCHSQWLS